ncbi:MAG: type II toxin-antitoxin system HicB family antitoxin [Nostoc sp.]|uniref:type II toxin-antitoxin system HicB family antitoxin n=1 Tax=Nostoc sp. TaxID=1180 RepID=UPI002FF7C46D
MKTFTAIVERDPDTKFYVGYVPGFPGAHSQDETLDELQENLREVIEMLLEDARNQTLYQIDIGVKKNVET